MPSLGWQATASSSFCCCSMAMRRTIKVAGASSRQSSSLSTRIRVSPPGGRASGRFRCETRPSFVTHFPLVLNNDPLPRQARDKRKGTLKREDAFVQASFCTPSQTLVASMTAMQVTPTPFLVTGFLTRTNHDHLARQARDPHSTTKLNTRVRCC